LADDDSLFFIPASDEHVAREKAKARELKRSQWWKRKRAKGECHYCGGSFPAKELTMDHVVPLIRGGETTKGNCVPACPQCNADKTYQLPVEWQGLLGDD
jgi:5-methylcytosine-specific restriction endonuclease McrA